MKPCKDKESSKIYWLKYGLVIRIRRWEIRIGRTPKSRENKLAQ